MKIGAHLSISGGYEKALQSVSDKGGNCLQIFSASPRGFNFAKPAVEQLDIFLKEKKRLTIDPIYFHASYLINLADSERTGDVSKKMLINELNLAPKMEVRGSIIHLGSFKLGKEKAEQTTITDIIQSQDAEDSAGTKYEILISNIKEILAGIPRESLFIIENAGNRKIGQTLEEIGRIIKDVGDRRVKVCLDTCHAHAAGYDLTTEKTSAEFLEKFDSLIGLDRLELVHLNDSRDPFGSLRDRHENIGEGHVGIEVFKNLLNNPRTKPLSFIIETPGFDDKGPDKKNLDIVKSLINS